MKTIHHHVYQAGGRAVACLVLFVFWITCIGCNPYAVESPTPTAVTTVTVEPATPSPRPPTATLSPSCMVRTGMPAGYLNMRAGAGVRYAVIRVLREGETLKVIQRAAWLKVTDAQGHQGFIYARYCK